VNYRTGPGTSYSVAGTLSKGKKVQAVSGYSLSANGYVWFKILLNGKYYYVASGYLKSSETLVDYTTTEKVNYRTGAGTSYSVAGTFKSGVKVQVVSGYSSQANGYTWYKISYNNQYYYICAKYLKKA
jgi:uncharacterized protein YgiM (DUF1202 family)